MQIEPAWTGIKLRLARDWLASVIALVGAEVVQADVITVDTAFAALDITS